MRNLIKITAIAAILGVAAPAAAEQSPEQRYCQVMYDAAKAIMEARQNGRPMPELMDGFRGNVIGELLVSRAYDTVRFHSDNHRQRAAGEFANEAYAQCHRMIREGL